MWHQLGLMSASRYACLLVEGAGLRLRISRPRNASLGARPFPKSHVSLASSDGDRPPSAAAGLVAARITPTTSCNERHVLSSITLTRLLNASVCSTPAGGSHRWDAKPRQRAATTARTRTHTQNSDTVYSDTRYAEARYAGSRYSGVRAARTDARTFQSGRLASFFRTRLEACLGGIEGGTRTRLYALRLRFYATHTDARHSGRTTRGTQHSGTHHRELGRPIRRPRNDTRYATDATLTCLVPRSGTKLC